MKDRFDQLFAHLEQNGRVHLYESLNENKYLKSYSSNKYFLDKHKDILNWLEKHCLEYVDISGSADNLINHYEQTDFHIGYRMHAHIFMNSISKPSVLIAEDGRGKALRNVISGLTFDGYTGLSDHLFSKISARIIKSDPYEADTNLPDDIVSNLDYEIKNDYPRLSMTRRNIDGHFGLMKKFILQLP